VVENRQEAEGLAALAAVLQHQVQEVERLGPGEGALLQGSTHKFIKAFKAVVS
jgi:hypothetical protein